VYRYLFVRKTGRRGETLPFTRWDILLSVILGVALLCVLAYSVTPDGWSHKKAIITGGVVLGCMLFAQDRRVVLGAAFAIVALRLGVAVVLLPNPLLSLLGILLFVGLSWLCLRNLR
jgi:hypothetical protein